jgi:hypothetical protein
MLAFTPAMDEYAAWFVGWTPSEVCRDDRFLFQAHEETYLKYFHQIIFMTQVRTVKAVT